MEISLSIVERTFRWSRIGSIINILLEPLANIEYIEYVEGNTWHNKRSPSYWKKDGLLSLSLSVCLVCETSMRQNGIHLYWRAWLQYKSLPLYQTTSSLFCTISPRGNCLLDVKFSFPIYGNYLQNGRPRRFQRAWNTLSESTFRTIFLYTRYHRSLGCGNQAQDIRKKFQFNLRYRYASFWHTAQPSAFSKIVSNSIRKEKSMD